MPWRGGAGGGELKRRMAETENPRNGFA